MATPAIAAPSLRAALDAAFAALPVQLHAPGTGGTAARAIADLYDNALAARFDQARAGIAAPLALVATGGWARRELAPYSDIDFILLHDGDEAAATQVADRLLYPLWDEKLAIGHAVCEAGAAARLAERDLATATALLDARHIAGDRRLSADLVRATLGALAPDGNPDELIGALAAENKARHERFGAALYVLEPNLKQGIGALRDGATALWAAAARWEPPRPGEDPASAGELVERLVAAGRLTPRQGDLLAAARDFQLRLRALVQLAARRRFDQLTFELQESIGPALYPDAPDERAAVEALMRDYYLHARAVVQVAERLLESARARARGAPHVVPIDESFVACNGELAPTEPQRLAERPAELVRLFRVAVAEQLPIDGPTRDLIAEAIARDPAPLAAAAAAARCVLDALVDLRDRATPAVFEVMHQLGILAAILPGWAPCTARVQHDLYHVYTVDQHQLYALAMQKQLARGELAAEHPLATELWRGVTRPAPLLLATLLHDVGKPLGTDHAEKGAVIAGAIARRLGLPAADVELVEWLVRQHLTMSQLSQRRDLADPEVVARFAERVATEEQLVALYLLTLCDTAMTAPGNLTAWKAELLRELVLRTRAHLRGESTDAAAARHAKLAVGLAGRRPRVALEVACFPAKGHSELAVVAPDQPGVLAAIAGALTANRIDVLGAVLGPADACSPAAGPGLVLDVFFVRDLKGEAIAEDDPRWQRLAGDLRALLAGPPDSAAVAALIARRRPPSGLPPRVTPGVRTEITIADDSAQATIVEVVTRDRVGVLYAITQTLAELGLDISLAKLATEGERVADVFYVTRAGQRLTDPADRARVVERLAAAVAE